MSRILGWMEDCTIVSDLSTESWSAANKSSWDAARWNSGLDSLPGCMTG